MLRLTKDLTILLLEGIVRKVHNTMPALLLYRVGYIKVNVMTTKFGGETLNMATDEKHRLSASSSFGEMSLGM